MICRGKKIAYISKGDYIDDISPEDMNGESLVFGEDECGRKFLAMNLQLQCEDQFLDKGIWVVFQRYDYDQTTYVLCRSHRGGSRSYDIAECFGCGSTNRFSESSVDTLKEIIDKGETHGKICGKYFYLRLIRTKTS